MRINELKIVGFKSFANKTTIRFDDNFVGIVGPNGSGKSNIIDAIRWVFGEQSSKNMRTKAGVDVIFGGTEKRKRQNFAEVTLVLDNKDNYLPLDYNEVSVTRRLYRSGESEYLLNNIDCRKKDIDELLMDSGMGKNSFSIISQGKIEEIVVSKPENRRQVVEEVAGVLKYKKRKEVAMRKLARTDENLVQVDLILSEMHERLGPLERQRTKALRYQDLKTKLESYEISYLANKIHITKDDYEAYMQINNEFEREIIQMNTNVTKLDTDIFAAEDAVANKSREINSLQARISITQENISSLQADFKILNERRLNAATDDSDRRRIDLENNIFELKEKIKVANNHYNKLNTEYTDVETKYNEYESKLASLRSKRFELRNKVAEHKEHQAINNYPFSVKRILESNQFNNAVCVRDIFSVDARYQEAIVASLGGRINEIIMDDVNDIKRAINFLKQQKLGRATFIPINDIRQYKLDNGVLNTIRSASGYVGIASDLIQTSDMYHRAFNNILGTTIIMDDIDSANKLSKAINNRYRIITLAGDVVSTSGSISGGHNKKVNTLVNNKKLEDLDRELENIDTEMEKQASLLHDVQSTYQSLKVEVNVERGTLDGLNSKLKMFEYEINELKPSEVQSTVFDSTSIEEDLEKLHGELSSLNEEKQQASLQYETLNEQKIDNTNKLRNLNEEIKIITKKENDNKILLSRLEVVLENAMNLLSQEYNLSYERAYELSDKNIDIDLYKDEVDKLKREIKTLGVVNIDSIKEYEEIKERHDFIFDQKEDLVKAKTKLEDIMNKLDLFVVERFEDVFEKLRSEFKVIFNELFGGGQADLILTEPTDLLNTGVEIIAQPPGKKLQTISLLSGGEKSLTAIALLFAILRIRTVPFAILDEVEAALDEANVKRYAKYIKIFSERTQFLVITHRQGTMEMVDSLYGITMAEKGVSSVVNVRLDINEEFKESNV